MIWGARQDYAAHPWAWALPFGLAPPRLRSKFAPGEFVEPELAPQGARENPTHVPEHENKKSRTKRLFLFWRARQDLNLRPLPSEGSTLSS